MTKTSQSAVLLASVTLAAVSLPACTSLLNGDQVNVRPVENIRGLVGTPSDPFYDSAVAAINQRDYASALNYLQQARARDSRDVRALNALGVVYDKLGRFDLSARYYAQAGAIEPASRIVAENISYSRKLQGLLNPGSATAMVEHSNALNTPATAGRIAWPGGPPAVPQRESSQPAGALSVVTSTSNAASPRLSGKTIPQPAVPAFPITRASIAPAQAPPPLPVITDPSTEVGNSVSAAAVASAPTPTGARVPAVRNLATIQDRLPAGANRQYRKPNPLGARDKGILTIGQPIQIVNASGDKTRAGMVSRRLTRLGWTVRLSNAKRAQPATTLSYAAPNLSAAKAMLHTLPFPTRLILDQRGASGIQLVIGRDYLSWKPRNARLATLWQGDVIASLRKPILGGVQ